MRRYKPLGPPVASGPYLDAWPTVNSPQGNRPDRASFGVGSSPMPSLGNVSAGGAFIPPDSAPTYDLSQFVIVGGSKPFSVPQISTLIIEAPPSYRNYLHLRNASGAGGANIYIEFGANAVADAIGIAGSGIRMEPNEQFLWDDKIPQDDLYAIADAAGGLLVVSFGVIAVPGP